MGVTALMEASSLGMTAAKDLLIEKGADVRLLNCLGKSSVDISIDSRHLAMADELVYTEYRQDIEHKLGQCNEEHCCCLQYRQAQRRFFCACGHPLECHVKTPNKKIVRERKDLMRKRALRRKGMINDKVARACGRERGWGGGARAGIRWHSLAFRWHAARGGDDSVRGGGWAVACTRGLTGVLGPLLSMQKPEICQQVSDVSLRIAEYKRFKAKRAKSVVKASNEKWPPLRHKLAKEKREEEKRERERNI